MDRRTDGCSGQLKMYAIIFLTRDLIFAISLNFEATNRKRKKILMYSIYFIVTEYIYEKYFSFLLNNLCVAMNYKRQLQRQTLLEMNKTV